MCKGHSHYLKNCPYTKTAVQAASKKQRAETSSWQLSNKTETRFNQIQATIDSLQKKLKEVESKQKLKKAYTARVVVLELSSNKDKY